VAVSQMRCYKHVRRQQLAPALAIEQGAAAERDRPGKVDVATARADLLTRCQAYNMIAQRDSQVMTGLGEAARLDSGAMKTIAVVTMAFLPPTFLSVRTPTVVTLHVADSK
jgi:hypothetical protein